VVIGVGSTRPLWHQPHQPAHPLGAAGAERGADRLVAHPDAPLGARQGDVLAVAVVADVRDRAAGAGDLDAGLEGGGGAERLDRRVDAEAAGELEDRLDRVDSEKSTTSSAP
jgi:hypothetical protein